MSPLAAALSGPRPRNGARLVITLVALVSLLPPALVAGAAGASGPAPARPAVAAPEAAAVEGVTAAEVARTRKTRLLTPRQCRRSHARPARERACVKRWKAARSRAAHDAATPRLDVGVAFGNTLPWMSSARRRQALDDVVALGARSVRMDVPWSALQPDGPSTWRWGPFDTAIGQARARGLKVLVILTYTPRWAQDPSCTAGEFCPAADPQQFARYAAAVTRRYTPVGVTSYEVWNEPNLPAFWPDPNPQRYRALLAATTSAIRAVAPRSRVLFGGLAHQDSRDGRLSPADFVQQACQAGGCGLLDGISVHPYSFPMLASDETTWTTPWEHLFRDGPTTRSLVSVLDSLGLSDMKLELTEYGAPTGGQKLAASSGATWVDGVTDHVTEGRQAEIVADAIHEADRTPRIASLYVYTDRDGGVSANPLDRGATFGLRRADGSKKPAYAAMTRAVRSLTR